ncbi:copper resistance CopC/CopD family protein [Paenibacillus mendelii]|uniref:Copper resistance CopC/CopD family protein n=1 Tax=Paenibacillus mendelii TaxID=206163 RepID=A0ABV6J8R2_9BACL|nr:copper resistance protein CopC [Paenibacillus mendelii]MCQ6559612.1 copper resistance protein CopC/CopD [Paenibacillus mendelii]
MKSGASMITVLFLMLTTLLVSPGLALAHAELERAVPEPNTRMNEGPAAIELYFNEPIESKVGALDVLDKNSKAVTGEAPTAGTDRKSLKLPLPKLGEGVYTVSYSIVSSDGHPISGSYVFVVGNPPEAVDASSFDLHKQLGHEGHGDVSSFSWKTIILYIVRFLYYSAILLAAGVMLWSLLYKGGGDAMNLVRRKWELQIMRFLLVAAIIYVFMHASEMMQGYPASEYMKLFGETAVGRSWIALIALAAAGFPILKLGRIARVVWAAVLLGVESWSGHAVVFEPKAVSVLFDWLHLASAAVWIGGLVLLLALWFEDRKEAGRFAIVFSRAALASIALLILTGVAMTLIFMPSLRYLFYTNWGIMLLVKTGAVLLVLVVGAMLRSRVRRGDLPNFSMLRLDLGLMVIIIAIVGIFTYISPLPSNTPVVYHKMGTDMHLTLRISPNKPGMDNKFTVKIWLPEKTGAPKDVVLRLNSLDRKELGAIDVPLQTYEDDELTSFEGFVKSAYQAEGPYMPFAGKWSAELRVMDQDDNEKVEKYEFRNY